MKTCMYCGKQVEEDVNFCPVCGGQKFEERTTEETQEPAPAQTASRKKRKSGKWKLVIFVVSLCLVLSLGGGAYILYQHLQTQAVMDRTHLTEGQIQEAYEEGKTQLQDGNYEEAMDELQKVQGYKDADGLYERAKSEYSQQIYKEVDALKSQEKYEDALNLLEGVAAYYEGDTEYETRRTEISEAYVQYFFARAEERIAAGEYAEAIQILDRGQSRFGDSEEFSAKMAEAYNSYRASFISQAEEKQEAGDYDGAIQILKIAEDVFEDDTEIETLMQKIQKEQVLKELETYDQNTDYSGAIAYLNTAFKSMDEDVELTSKLNEYILKYKESLIQQAETTYAEEGYLAAVQLLQSSIPVIGEDAEIQEQIDHYKWLAPVRVSELEVMESDGYDFEYIEDIVDYMGNAYDYAIVCDYWNGEQTYYIAKQYLRMTGVFYLVRTTNSYLTIKIYGDDMLLYDDTITDKDQPQAFEVDLTGVEWLKIEFDSDGWPAEGRLGDVYLYKD